MRARVDGRHGKWWLNLNSLGAEAEPVGRAGCETLPALRRSDRDPRSGGITR